MLRGEVAGSPFPGLASQSGLDRRVAFLGFGRDIARIMQAVDLFVFPSRYEACSLVLLEAAASGLPVVTTCAAGGVELLSTGCSRRVTNPEDPLELARVLNSLLADPAELARMGREARRIALENSWEIMAQRYLNLYRELLGEWQPDAVLGARP